MLRDNFLSSLMVFFVSKIYSIVFYSFLFVVRSVFAQYLGLSFYFVCLFVSFFVLFFFVVVSHFKIFLSAFVAAYSFFVSASIPLI